MFEKRFITKYKKSLNDFINTLFRTEEEIEQERLKQEEETKQKKPKIEPYVPKKKNVPEKRYSISGGSSSDYKRKQLEKLLKELVSEKSSTIDFDKVRDLTFVEMVRIYIENKKMKDSKVYKAGLMDRRLFSKVINDVDYKPSKDTVFSFIFALKLTLSEANDLLIRAGYSFSHSIKKDIIVEYFVKEGIYDLNKINALLYEIDIKPIGRINE